MNSGKVYKEVTLKDGRKLTLRAPRWEDFKLLAKFVNDLVEEGNEEPDFGLLLYKKVTRKEELRWLSTRLVDIEEGKVIHVLAVGGEEIVGSCDVVRGWSKDTKHRGTLAIMVAKDWRDAGLGKELMKQTLIECVKSGMKIVELEVLATNKRALHVYQKIGFKITGSTPKGVLRNGKFIDKIRMAKEL